MSGEEKLNHLLVNILLEQFFDELYSESVRYHVKSFRQPNTIDGAIEGLNEYLVFEDHSICIANVRQVRK